MSVATEGFRLPRPIVDIPSVSAIVLGFAEAALALPGGEVEPSGFNRLSNIMSPYSSPRSSNGQYGSSDGDGASDGSTGNGSS
jgi:hypothetical protein